MTDGMNLVKFAVLFNDEHKKWDIVEVHVPEEIGLNPEDLSKWGEVYLRPNFPHSEVAKVIFWSAHEDQYDLLTEEQVANAIMSVVSRSPEFLIRLYNEIHIKKISSHEKVNGQSIFKVLK